MLSAWHLNLQFGCFFGLSELFKIRDMSKDFLKVFNVRSHSILKEICTKTKDCSIFNLVAVLGGGTLYLTNLIFLLFVSTTYVKYFFES